MNNKGPVHFPEGNHGGSKGRRPLAAGGPSESRRRHKIED
jgi:hypothetical protein